MQAIKPRNQMDPALCWRLEDMVATDALWQERLTEALADCDAFGRYAGALGESPEALLAALEALFALDERVTRLTTYAHMRRDEDNANPTYQGMAERSVALCVRYASATAFVSPELLAAADSVRAWMDGADFAPYRRYLYEVLRGAPHTLSPEGEGLLSLMGEVTGAPETIFSMLHDADMTFPEIDDGQGGRVRITSGRYIPLLESPDRAVRKAAYEGYYDSFAQVKNTMAATFAASLKKDAFLARARKYPSALAMSLDADEVPEAVYTSLIEAVHAHLPAMYRYVDLRKRALGLEEIHMYDLYTHIVDEVEMEIPYEKAWDMVLEALAPLGEDYRKLLLQARAGGWVDVYENEGKTSGAYSNSVYGVHPYVLLNYQNTLDNALTLAHELGHAMHSALSNAHQPYATAGYPLILAEVASTVNEALMTRYLLDHTSGKERLYILNNYLETIRTTVYRQVMFAEFEMKAHQRAEAGEDLTPQSICDLYGQINQTYYGPDMVTDERIALEWARIPHFYSTFYVYKYATGFSAALAIATAILEGKPGALEGYLAFLSSGGSDKPLALLKRAGVDLTQPEAVDNCLRVFEDTLAQMEELLAVGAK